jgi:hypothetical protein
VPAAPAEPGDPAAEPEGTAPASPAAQPATPAGGLDAGDAPWRRAARMTGAEPGGAWETAPLPVVAEARAEANVDKQARTVDKQARTEAAPVVPEVRTDEMKVPVAEEGRAGGAAMSASPGVVIVSRAAATPTAASLWTELEAMQAAARSEAERGHEHVEPAAAPTPSAWTEPVGHAACTADAVEAAVVPPAAGEQDATDGTRPAAPVTVSRPLSDPDLTPLMGIPIIRPVAAEPPAAEPPAVEPPATEPPATEASPDDTPADELPGPSPRVTDTLVPDDEVVVLLPPTPTGTFPVESPSAISGSPQPVWFRVVRRDGEPVPAAVVALLDDHGREVDTTKTAVDGGGELHSPHAGRFLMIVSADGYQPRAALLTVDDEPVELALLLPRSAAVGGTVRSGGESVRDARVAVRQDHDAVDEALTGGDGSYRFDDLAEGTYTVTATGGSGCAVARLSLAEGADVDVDLDLAGPDRAR